MNQYFIRLSTDCSEKIIKQCSYDYDNIFIIFSTDYKYVPSIASSLVQSYASTWLGKPGLGRNWHPHWYLFLAVNHDLLSLKILGRRKMSSGHPCNRMLNLLVLEINKKLAYEMVLNSKGSILLQEVFMFCDWGSADQCGTHRALCRKNHDEIKKIKIGKCISSWWLIIPLSSTPFMT